QLAHRVGSPLLLLGSHRLRNPVYGGLTVSSFARVEHPDDRHPDDCCRAVPEVTVAIARAVGADRRALVPPAAGRGADAQTAEKRNRGKTDMSLCTAYVCF